MFSYEICSLKFLKTPSLKNICKQLPSSSSSFKLDLVDLTVFPDLNMRLAKIKPFRGVCISKFWRFCSNASSFLCYQVQKLPDVIFLLIFNELMSKVTDVSVVFFWCQ